MRRKDPVLLLAPALLLLAALGILGAAVAAAVPAHDDPRRLEALVAEAVDDQRPVARLAVEVLTAWGHAEAARALGLRLLVAHPEEPEAGRGWLERAAELGDARAAQALRHALQTERQALTDRISGGTVR